MKRLGSIAAIAALTVSSTASAQPLHDFENAGRTDMRATAGVTIPLGNGRQSKNSAPRFDLNVESTRIGQASFDHRVRQPAVIGWQPQRKSTLSFTFEQRPKMMLNGRKLATFGPSIYADEDDADEKDGGGVSTGVIIAGVGVLVLVGVIALGVDDIQDDFDNLAPG